MAIEGNGRSRFNDYFSTIGQRLLQMPIQGGDWYNVSNLSAGTYLVQLSAKDGRLLGTKLITKY
ncbi:MAG: T9SS type A sorting domain-containing protein [Saprospiraceae bacterium]